MTLDSKIDDLYRLPLGEFVAARNALAKTLTGAEKEQVKALAKPTVVPWSVNQLYWRSRTAYDKLMKSGEALRTAQLAALDGRPKGKGPDVKEAAESHRAALAVAVRDTTRLAEVDRVKPDTDDLARMLESLSLAASRSGHPGRWTEIIRPAGFEALAGISPASFAAALSQASAPARPSKPPQSAPADKERAAAAAEAAAAERKREQEEAARKRAAEAEVKAAERALEQARAAEARAREAFEEAERNREAAKARLSDARKALERM